MTLRINLNKPNTSIETFSSLASAHHSEAALQPSASAFIPDDEKPVLSQAKKHFLPLQERIEGFLKSKKRIPSPVELKALTEEHNHINGPIKIMAGKTIAHVNGTKIYYNHEGMLLTGTPFEQIVRYDAQITNKSITKSRLEQIKSVYYQIVDDCPYNNLAPFLEMIRFYDKAKQHNPSLNIKEAFTSHTPDPCAIFDKYRSGTCGIVSAVVARELAKMNISCLHIGEDADNLWNTLPIVNTSGKIGIPWRQNKKHSENIGHIRTLIRYTDPQKKEGAIILEGGFEHDQILGYYPEFDNRPLETMLRQNKQTDFRPIESLSSILKKRIAANYKMIVRIPGSNTAHMGVDLLKGNIYMSSEATALIGHQIPLTEEGKVHIDLTKIHDPLHTDTFFINAEALELNHRQALQMFIYQVSGLFRLPADTYENMMSLSKHLDEFFSSIALPPLSLLKEENEHIQKINLLFFQNIESLKQAKKSAAPSETCESKDSCVKACCAAIEKIHTALDTESHALLKEAISEFYLRLF